MERIREDLVFFICAMITLGFTVLFFLAYTENPVGVKIINKVIGG